MITLVKAKLGLVKTKLKGAISILKPEPELSYHEYE